MHVSPLEIRKGRILNVRRLNLYQLPSAVWHALPDERVTKRRKGGGHEPLLWKDGFYKDGFYMDGFYGRVLEGRVVYRRVL